MAHWSRRAHRRRRARRLATDGPGRLDGHGRRACVPSEVSGSEATVERVLTDDVSRRKPRTKWASGTNAKGQRQTFMFYAICVSRKKSASGLTSEFIATCSECTCSLRCLTYSYAACSRSKSG